MNEEQRAATGAVADPTYSVRARSRARWFASIRVSSAVDQPRRRRRGWPRWVSTRACVISACTSSTQPRNSSARPSNAFGGRKVRAFISGLDTNKDVAAELFYMED